VLISDRHAARKELSGAMTATTNNRMELTAAIRGLEALKTPCRVEIYTDSQYVKNAFTEGWLTKWRANGWKTADRKPVSNADLWEELLELAKVHEIEWRWVRGHGDDEENNRADRLAVDARIELAQEAGAKGDTEPCG
jgi:ribonuclease HI